jgi:hypothetical protein
MGGKDDLSFVAPQGVDQHVELVGDPLGLLLRSPVIQHDQAISGEREDPLVQPPL